MAGNDRTQCRARKSAPTAHDQRGDHNERRDPVRSTRTSTRPGGRERDGSWGQRFAAVASIHQADHTAHVLLTGELCAFTAPDLADLFDVLVADGVERLHIDLTELRLCTSQGIHLFDETHRRLLAVGGSLTLTGATGVVRRVLDIVGMEHQDTP